MGSVAGCSDISGTYTKEGFRVGASDVVGGTKRGIRPSRTGITEEGDRVAVEAVSDGKTPGGKPYLNQYQFLFEFKNGKFTAVHEYIGPTHLGDKIKFLSFCANGSPV